MAEFINLEPEIPQEQTAPINIDVDGVGGSPLDLPLASARAYKADFALGGIGYTYDRWMSAINNGEEGMLREEVASQIDLKRQEKFIKDLPTLTPEQIKTYWGEGKNASINYTNPDTVVERAYGAAISSYMDLQKVPNSFIADFQNEFPMEAKAVQDEVTDAVAFRQYLQRKNQDAQQLLKDQSLIGYGVDILKTAVPFYTSAKLRGTTDDVGPLEGGLLGGHLEAVRKALVSKDLDTAIKLFNERYDVLARDNPALAVTFTQAMLGQSYSAQMMNDLFEAVDVPASAQTLWAPVKAIAKRTVFNETKTAAKQLVAATADPDLTPAKLANVMGDTVEASVKNATDRITKSLANVPADIRTTLDDIPRVYVADIEDLAKGATAPNVSRELTGRIIDQTVKHLDNLVQVAGEMAKVNRIPELTAIEGVIKANTEGLKRLYPGLSNRILEFGELRFDPAANVFALDTLIGKSSGELFATAQGAANAASKLGILNHTIEQQGAKFYIKVSKPLDETQDLVRNLFAQTKTTKDPEGFFSSWFGFLRTPEETLSDYHRLARKVATYAPSGYVKMAQDEAKYIQDLARGVVKRDPITGGKQEVMLTGAKKRWNEWQSIVKLGRSINDKDGQPGRWFESVAELNEKYLMHLKRLPDDVETQAYFAFKRFMNMDYVLRNTAVYKSMHRLGVEEHYIKLLGAEGKMVDLPKLNAIRLRHLPGSDANIAVLGKKIGDEKVFVNGKYSPKYMKQLADDIESGKRVILRIYNDADRPLQGLGKIGAERIEYVVANRVETKNLSPVQLPRRGGGHWEYDYDFYIKQANVRPESIGSGNSRTFRHWYEGDTTIMPVQVRGMGKEVASHLDHVRKLLADRELGKGWEFKAQQLKEAKEYAEKHLMMDFDEIQLWFGVKRDEQGKRIQGWLNLHEPIQVVPKNKTIGGISDELEKRYSRVLEDGSIKSTFVDGTRRGLSAQNSIDFTGRRDAMDLLTPKNVGTTHNPLYDFEPAKMIDPLPSMDRALSRIINASYMDDYKAFAVERWLAQNGKHLKGDINEIRSAPYWYFQKAETRPGVDPKDITRINATRWQIQQLLGTSSIVDRAIQGAGQTLADGIYGATRSERLALLPQHALAAATSAPQFLRSIAFNAKLGFFAVPQLWVQAQTMGVIAGIAGPTHAISGTTAVVLSRYARFNSSPMILDKLDDIMSKMYLPGSARWKPGEFKESMEHMQRTGFGNIHEGSLALIDDMAGPKVVNTAAGDFLHAGQIFFREGERAVRYAAWHTAYKEFRTINPTGRLTEHDVGKILERADLLSVNMSRASNSALQTGIFSLPLQFLTYQFRLAELIFGKRLTNAERFRLIAMQSALYGVPAGVASTGLPVMDYLRKDAVENGYVVGDKYLETAWMEGIPSLLTGMATGVNYNIGERYGSSGMQIINEALFTDSSFLKLAGGASGSVVGNTLQALHPFWAQITNFLHPEDQRINVNESHILHAFKEISTVQGINKMLVAIHTGDVLTRKEAVAETGVGATDAVFRFLTGLQNQNINESWQQSVSYKSQQELEKKVGDRFTLEWRRAIRADAEGNHEQAKEFYANAKAMLRVGGVREDEMYQYIKRANEGMGGMIGDIDTSYYLKNAPDDKRELREDAFIRKQRLREQRQGN